jgi:tripartite-type tricarboxylate transporter receptor subunit TctC
VRKYPTRPISIIVPFGKGSTAELICSVVSDQVSLNIGQLVTIELMPQDNGRAALKRIEYATPDGHTLGIISQSTQVFNSISSNKLLYKPTSLVPVTPLAAVSNVLTVHPTCPADTPAQLALMAKSNPGKLTYASGGEGTSHHLCGLLFASMADVKIKHVPHSISVQGIKSVVEGEITMGFFNLPTVIDHVKSGRLKALAVTSKARSQHLPHVSTFDACGLRGYDVVTWFGIAAPAGTPAELAQLVHSEFAQASTSLTVRSKFEAAGLDAIQQLDPVSFRRVIDSEVERWTLITKSLPGDGALDQTNAN